MPEIPEQPLLKAERAIADEMLAGRTSPEALARAALTAAAPLLADACASAILAHAERQHPRDHNHVPTPRDRHFDIAARVAAGTFDSDEDRHRAVAGALNRGDFTECAPEVPRLTEEGEQ